MRGDQAAAALTACLHSLDHEKKHHMPAAGSIALDFGPAEEPSTGAKRVCLAGRRSVNVLAD